MVKKELLHTVMFTPEELMKLFLNSTPFSGYVGMKGCVPNENTVIVTKLTWDSFNALGVEQIQKSEHKKTGLTQVVKTSSEPEEFRIGLKESTIQKLIQQSIIKVSILIHKHAEWTFVGLNNEEKDEIDGFLTRAKSCFVLENPITTLQHGQQNGAHAREIRVIGELS